MKVTSSALATLLLAALWTEAHCDSFISQSNTCCMKDNFVPRRISPKHIKSCRHTGPNCSRQAVIVTLTQGKEVCVDPSKIRLATCKGKQEKLLKDTQTAQRRQQQLDTNSV
ncbi:Interleukin-8 [Platysternon megacephalum]|uniref:Interleukin-8 n=1 Tax=Platysternon megacephalum TaxID=55544 RepID=A0A4D9DQ89_9SAUR|nr:Interleukin-8 [Platysternon megacephalum]